MQDIHANTASNQDNDNDNQENGEKQPNITEYQTPDCAEAAGSAGIPDLSERHVPGHNAGQPDGERQEIQNRCAYGTHTSRQGSQEQTDGQVETPLQDIKTPTKDTQHQAGFGEFISERTRVHLWWVGRGANLMTG